jgi:hypothetical protein
MPSSIRDTVNMGPWLFVDFTAVQASLFRIIVHGVVVLVDSERIGAKSPSFSEAFA